jgi:hypothetical protein
MPDPKCIRKKQCVSGGALGLSALKKHVMHCKWSLKGYAEQTSHSQRAGTVEHRGIREELTVLWVPGQPGLQSKAPTPNLKTKTKTPIIGQMLICQLKACLVYAVGVWMHRYWASQLITCVKSRMAIVGLFSMFGFVANIYLHPKTRIKKWIKHR